MHHESDLARMRELTERDSGLGVVVIGTSTGGPRTLLKLLSVLAPDFGAGIVIAQHMPPGFTRLLAQRLNAGCALEVTEARDEDEIVPGRVLVAPAGARARIDRSGTRLRVRVDRDPAAGGHRPSIDLLLTSAAAAAGPGCVGVILTGMGGDGAAGLQTVREAGGRTFAESEETAVIYGMPRAAAPAAERILPLPQLAAALAALRPSRLPPLA